MANLKNYLATQAEKSPFMDRDGNFLTTEKVEKLAKKAYIEELKNGKVSATETLQTFTLNYLNENFVKATEIIDIAVLFKQVNPLLDKGGGTTEC